MKIKNKLIVCLSNILLLLILSCSSCTPKQNIDESKSVSLSSKPEARLEQKHDPSETAALIETTSFKNEAASQHETAPASAADATASLDDKLSLQIEKQLASMSLEAKVAQLFFVTPESLTGYSKVIQAGEQSRKSFKKYPVGGLIYFSQNLETPEQTRSMLENMQKIALNTSGFPIFLSTDEEGGEVARLQGKSGFGIPKTPSMRDIGKTNDLSEAKQAGSTIGNYLQDYGFNLNFAPDADVLTEPKNRIIGSRSFGSEPSLVSNMAKAYEDGLNEQGVLGCYKHFPGHGGTLEDSHKDYAFSYKTLEELENVELFPFKEAAKRQAAMIMISHISLPNVLGDDTPASLSKKIVTDILRVEYGYQGIIITDALDMGAIHKHYSTEKAVQMAFNAGVDMFLIAGDFRSAYQSLLSDFQTGKLSEERLDESIRRILRVKLKLS